MSSSTDELIAQSKNEEAPLLPLLYRLHERDSYLSDEALRAVPKRLRIPIADLFGTITFYHHFAREPGGFEAPHVCTGPICCLRGAHDLVDSLDGATGMPCSGRCDEPVPVIRGNHTLVGTLANELAVRETPMPPAKQGDHEECVFAHIREPDRKTLDGYRRTGGYEVLEKAVTLMSPDALITMVDESELAGRGSAGFPTGRKWRAVAEADGGPQDGRV